MKCNVCGQEFGNGAYCQHCNANRITALGNYSGGYNAPNVHKDVSKNAITSGESQTSGYDSNNLEYEDTNNLNQTSSKQIRAENERESFMICYNCANAIPSDSAYCPCCGIKLIAVCPKCGHKYYTEYKICNQCGTNIKTYHIEQEIFRIKDLMRRRYSEELIFNPITGKFESAQLDQELNILIELIT